MLFNFFSRKSAPSLAISPPPMGPKDSPSPPPSLSPSPPTAAISPAQLHAQIASVPAPILHSYTLENLSPSATAELPTHTFHALCAFFSSLAPPPRLHCVRCHKGYFEVENTDHSCLVPHDDDSAAVERVRNRETQYETLWGCCGRTVEGSGDMGPPDGWCYEGKHTTDTRRARFRADSSPQDDKLVSCSILHCSDPHPRKRRRSNDVTSEEEETDGDVSSISASSKRPTRKRTRVKAEDTMDVDNSAATKSPRVKPKPKPKPKTKSHARTDSSATSLKVSPSSSKNLSSPAQLKNQPSGPASSSPKFIGVVLISPKSSPGPRANTSSPDPYAKIADGMDVDPRSGSPLPKKRSAVKPKASMTSLKPKSSTASLKPTKESSQPKLGASNLRSKQSAPNLKSKPSMVFPDTSVPASTTSPLKSTATSASLNPESMQPAKTKTKPKPKSKAQSRTLGEIVDTSIDGESSVWVR